MADDATVTPGNHDPELESFIKEGIQTLNDIAYMKEGLKEATKSLAEKLDVKPADLSKALAVAHKRSLGDEQDKIGVVEQLLHRAGYLDEAMAGSAE
jgi:hypothetical protein